MVPKTHAAHCGGVGFLPCVQGGQLISKNGLCVTAPWLVGDLVTRCLSCPFARSPCEVTDDKEGTVVQELCRTQADGRPAQNQRLDSTKAGRGMRSGRPFRQARSRVKVMEADQPRVPGKARPAVQLYPSMSSRRMPGSSGYLWLFYIILLILNK